MEREREEAIKVDRRLVKQQQQQKRETRRDVDISQAKVFDSVFFLLLLVHPDAKKGGYTALEAV